MSSFDIYTNDLNPWADTPSTGKSSISTEPSIDSDVPTSSHDNATSSKFYHQYWPCKQDHDCEMRSLMIQLKIVSAAKDLVDELHVLRTIETAYHNKTIRDKTCELSQSDTERLFELFFFASKASGTRDEHSSPVSRWVRELARKTHILPPQLLCEDVVLENPFSPKALAGGASCDVYKGTLGKNTSVAIKTFRIFEVQNQNQILLKANICHEVLYWQFLNHPNILPFLGVSLKVKENQISLISPWMAGGVISSYLASNPSVGCAELFYQAADGIAYLHNLDPPLIHGDIRSANILIDDLGCVRVADFGLIMVTQTHLAATTHRHSKDSGTLVFLAPELLKTESGKGRKTDVYAFGLMMLEAITGKGPFGDEDPYRTILKVMNDGLTPRKPIGCGRLTDELWQIMECCWKHEPLERPAIESVRDQIKCPVNNPNKEPANPRHPPIKSYSMLTQYRGNTESEPIRQLSGAPPPHPPANPLSVSDARGNSSFPLESGSRPLATPNLHSRTVPSEPSLITSHIHSRHTVQEEQPVSLEELQHKVGQLREFSSMKPSARILNLSVKGDNFRTAFEKLGRVTEDQLKRETIFLSKTGQKSLGSTNAQFVVNGIVRQFLSYGICADVPSSSNISDDQNLNYYGIGRVMAFAFFHGCLIDCTIGRPLLDLLSSLAKGSQTSSSISPSLSGIADGFFSVISYALVSPFTSLELKMLLCGRDDFDLEEWRQNTHYVGYLKDSSTIQIFWQFLGQLNQSSRKELFYYCTGNRRLPVVGFRDIFWTGKLSRSPTTFTIARSNTFHSETQSAKIHLPAYQTIESLRADFAKVVQMNFRH